MGWSRLQINVCMYVCVCVCTCIVLSHMKLVRSLLNLHTKQTTTTKMAVVREWKIHHLFQGYAAKLSKEYVCVH